LSGEKKKLTLEEKIAQKAGELKKAEQSISQRLNDLVYYARKNDQENYATAKKDIVNWLKQVDIYNKSIMQLLQEQADARK